MISYMLEDGIDVENHRIAIGNSGLLKEQEWFEKEIKKIFPNAEIVTGYVNPSIGVHCGPDNVGFAFHGKKKDSPEENK